jgi:hypothetical protein
MNARGQVRADSDAQTVMKKLRRQSEYSIRLKYRCPQYMSDVYEHAEPRLIFLGAGYKSAD